jgi:hypothetical protein
MLFKEVSGADISVNCSVSALKNRKNCILAHHTLVFANKSIDNILCGGRLRLHYIYKNLSYTKSINKNLMNGG